MKPWTVEASNARRETNRRRALRIPFPVLSRQEVPVISSKRFWLAATMALLACGPVLGQGWGVGASAGLVNDVDKKFRLDEFRRHDVNAWVQFEIEEKVQLRAMFGSLKVHGANAGTTPVVDGTTRPPLPDLTDRINYGTLGASYEFWEGDYTSGLFGGIGGYRIEPEAVAPELETFRDKRETVFGLHVGVEGSVRVVSRLSVLARLTFHKIYSDAGRSLLTANAGLAYRF